MSGAVEEMMGNLKRIRELYGEEKFQYAAKQAARILMAHGPEMREQVKKALEGLVDLDSVEKDPPPPFPPGQDLVVEAIKSAFPSVTTQAQFDVVVTALEATKTTLNAIFLRDKAKAADGRKAIEQALEAAERVTDITSKLGQVPEAATSKEAEAFKKPPAQFHEQEILSELLAQLTEIKNKDELNAWYHSNRARIDEVVTQKNRNLLLDAIRGKKRGFLNEVET